MSIDIKSMLIGRTQGKNAGGGKAAVLTELTVTENGVYDQPVISNGPEPITWDGVIGDKVTAPGMSEGDLYVKVSDAVFTADDFIGCTLTTSEGHDLVGDETNVYDLPTITTLVLMVVSAKEAGVASGDFPETGTYFALGSDGSYVKSLTFAGGTTTPADGWNKVTVNVAGDIIDVPELPTENIEEGKIYRMTETDEAKDEIYVCIPDYISEPMILSDFMAQENMGSNLVYHMVDSIPDISEMTIADQETMTLHLYIISETGEIYTTFDGSTVTDFMNDIMHMDYNYDFGGTVNSIEEMTQYGYYFLPVEAKTTLVYGVPNVLSGKKLYEYNDVDAGWEKCESGELAIADVEWFPTVADDNKVYRIKEEAYKTDIYFLWGEMIVNLEKAMEQEAANYGTITSRDYYVVNELPEQPNITVDTDSEKLYHIYIMKDTGEPFVSFDGETYVAPNRTQLIGGSSYGGLMKHPKDWPGGILYCTLIGIDADFMYTYGASNLNNNVSFYEYREDENGGHWNSLDVNAFKTEISQLNYTISTLEEELKTAEAKAFTSRNMNIVRGTNRIYLAFHAYDKWIDEIYIPYGIEALYVSTFRYESGKDGAGNPSYHYVRGLKKLHLPGSIKEIGAGAVPSGVSEIYFEGYKHEWKDYVDLASGWYDGTDDYIIYCIDGTIAKDGTET